MLDPISVLSIVGFGLGTISFLADTVAKTVMRKNEYLEYYDRISGCRDRLELCKYQDYQECTSADETSYRFGLADVR